MESYRGFRVAPTNQGMSTLESDDASEFYQQQCDSGICCSSIRSDFSSFGGPSKPLEGTLSIEEQMSRLGFGERGARCNPVANCPSVGERGTRCNPVANCTSVYSGDFYSSVSSVEAEVPVGVTRLDEMERALRVDTNLTLPWQREDPTSELFQQDEDGDTQLHLAIIKPDHSVAIRIIEVGQFTDRLDIQNDHQQTPLHLAVITDQPQLVRALVVSGASSMARDKHGNTPLHLACKLGHAQCVERLTAPPSYEEEKYIWNERQRRGMSPQTTSYGRSTTSGHISLLNYEGDTCLHLAMSAAAEIRTSILNYLLNICGADVNAQEGKCGLSLLHLAVRSRDMETVRFLLSQPNILINQCCYNGYTPLDFALSLHQIHLAQVLRSVGALSFANNSSTESSEISQDEDFDDLVIAGGCFQR